MDHKIKAIPRGTTCPTLMAGESFDVYAQAYYDAATGVFEKFWESGDPAPSGADWTVWPVMFLPHHFVELEFKEVIHLSWSIGQEVSVTLDPYPDNEHNLKKLMDIAESNLQLLATKIDEIDFEAYPLRAIDLRNLIEDIEDFTEGGVNVRYPVHRRSQGGEPTLPQSYVADIPKVMQGMKGLRSKFGGVIGLLDHIDQTLWEMRRENYR